MTKQDKYVLVVDDEPSILEMLSNYLAVDADQYGIKTAENVAQALSVLETESIFIVISDVYMPGDSGIDLLANIRRDYPNISVVLMTGYATPQLREEVAESECLHFLEKPIDLKSLRAIIHQRTNAVSECSGFDGTLKNIQLEDLIQMCCLSSITTTFRVRMGRREGSIYIADGDIVHAVCGDRSGEAAFYEILGWKSGGFESNGALDPPKRTIDKNWQYLLMEGMRLADERGADAEETLKSMGIESRRTPARIRTLIVDDSPVMCRILREMLETDEAVEVVGTAGNGEAALQMIADTEPDLITLDVNMPVMGGRTALKHIMINQPCPVVIISAAGNDSGANIFDFLCLGAVSFLGKPVRTGDMEAQHKRLLETVKRAATAKIENFIRIRAPGPVPPSRARPSETRPAKHLVVVSAGPGGFAELVRLIALFPANLAAGVIAFLQMPGEYLQTFAGYLNERSFLSVTPLPDNAVPFVTGSCFAAPDDFFVKITMPVEGGIYAAAAGPETGAENRVDDFFSHATEAFSGRIDVVLLSGAKVGRGSGLSRLRDMGGGIFSQPRSRCMVPEPLIHAGKMIEQEADSPEIVSRILRSVRGKAAI